MSSGTANVTAYLAAQKKTANKDLAAEWTTIEELYNEKLWNELTIKLNGFVHNPTLQDEDTLMQLYTNFISTFETKINPYGLVRILEVFVDHISDKTQAVEFLEKLKEKVKICDEAVLYIQVMQGNIYLTNLNDLTATKKIIEELRDILEEAGNVTPVHGKYFMLASQYYRRVGKHSDYYRCGLQFLGCSMNDYPKDQWPQQAFFLGLAALLGDGIYNIGELLAHPILTSLKGTENEWLVELLNAFNSGDIKKFNDMKKIWSKIPDLAAQEIKLRQKISLLCLMEMTFKRKATERSIKFEDIAAETNLQLSDIELLIMKALAQNLVRGEIDQVAGVVNMSWVQPRVLDRKQIVSMAKTVDDWMASITSMEKLMESRAAEILTT
ncbi:26S proteasome non-ATPase regulatory subunit 13-like [Teleopsis dalmanni]|uniref:26S proteasome non-ATPase regulatory subunit 13-like n=1 Tax=Teleopsis dalmanni TaxID=139649 RepID=UPI0018CD7F92|nr:26S proteasome non-ATPase regulatory subunit 13-like [Teleopsis dalmanni]XP_037953553.1 26S proteasome non-ATPase regulatory subunit 13-like [Teleopsis dalmanni]